MFRHPRALALALSIALPFALTGCNGVIGDPGLPGGAGGAGGGGGTGGTGAGGGIGSGSKAVCVPNSTPQPGSSPIRRLTRFEYNNTVADLLGDTTKPAAGFPDEGGSGFDNNADLLSVTRLLAEKYLLAAEGIATRATVDLSKLLGCDAASDEVGCVTSWVDRFGLKAWRRPLEPAERQAMVDLYSKSRAGSDVKTSVQVVLQAFLQSPFFLYRVETSTDSAASGGATAAPVKLGGYEMASRLSYLIWGSMPDAELFRAAKAGELGDKANIEKQTRRMLADARARRMVQHFHQQWLGYKNVDQLQKDPNTFPAFDSTVAALLKEETTRFIDYVFWTADGTLKTLLTAPYTFVNSQLAAYYDLSADSATADKWVKVDVAHRDRSGVLTQGGLMALYAKPSQTSPIHRGVWIREHVLCTEPPAPPDDADIRFPAPDPNTTVRERLAQHRKDPACKGCHELMDPLGFGFEHFDGAGRYRTHEAGNHPVDASGYVTSSDIDGNFVGAAALGKKLASSKQVAECVSVQWFRFAYGRTDGKADACSLQRINEMFAKSGYNMRELLVALTQTDAFRYRAADGGGS